MLPPGHVAGGYLAAYGIIKFTHPQLALSQINHLLLFGAVFGFLPDMDMFLWFFKRRSLSPHYSRDDNHRQSFAHIPILWFFAGIIIYFLSATAYGKTLGLIVWLASWSHFVLDSVEFGIMWFWPFSHKFYALKKSPEEEHWESTGFFSYWRGFVKNYLRHISFYLEILIIIFSLIVYLK